MDFVLMMVTLRQCLYCILPVMKIEKTASIMEFNVFLHKYIRNHLLISKKKNQESLFDEVAGFRPATYSKNDPGTVAFR